jgi:uncharacterized protein YutE (UPF0331/DUF86 family)
MKYNGIIERKLRIIEENISEIKSWEIKSLEQLKNSSLLQKATERALQVSVEVMIDVSERILSLKNIAPANTSVENMEKLVDLGIIKTMEDYADMIKFRNFIVHRYEKIDIEIIYSILKTKLHLLNEFVNEIREN